MFALAGALALAGAGPASAQVGAIGIVPGGGVSGKDALIGTPIFTNSALTLPRSRWGVGVYAGYSALSADIFDPSLGVTFSREVASTALYATAAYGLSDRAMIGLQLNPVNNVEITDKALGQSFSESTSGMGDATAFGKYQLSRSANGATSMAGIVSVGLPIGDEDKGFSSGDPSIGAGLAVSHSVGQTTWHVDGGVSKSMADGAEAVLSVNGAAVFSLSPRMWLNAELLTSSVDGEFLTFGAPGLRFAIGQRAFLDLGVAFKVAASNSDAQVPTTVLLGFLMVP
jgi:hypothetical protein